MCSGTVWLHKFLKYLRGTWHVVCKAWTAGNNVCDCPPARWAPSGLGNNFRGCGHVNISSRRGDIPTSQVTHRWGNGLSSLAPWVHAVVPSIAGGCKSCCCRWSCVVLVPASPKVDPMHADHACPCLQQHHRLKHHCLQQHNRLQHHRNLET